MCPAVCLEKKCMEQVKQGNLLHMLVACMWTWMTHFIGLCACQDLQRQPANLKQLYEVALDDKSQLDAAHGDLQAEQDNLENRYQALEWQLENLEQLYELVSDEVRGSGEEAHGASEAKELHHAVYLARCGNSRQYSTPQPILRTISAL